MDIEKAFKPYDIRGLNGSEVDGRFAFLVGKALGQKTFAKKILVATDNRPLSPVLKQKLVDGLSLSCSNIQDIGIVPVPEFYFGATTGNFDLGIMVTASHVSDKESGFKLVGPAGLPFDQQQILNLKKIMLKIQNDAIVVPTVATQPLDIDDSYIEALLHCLGPFTSTLNIGVDYTNSSIAKIAKKILNHLKINFVAVASTNTGNPLLDQNRRELAELVVNKKFDLGIIWDSDGDRVVFIDGQGKLIPLSFVIGILGAAEIKNHGSKVVTDVRAGLVVKELVEEAGGKLEVTPSWSQNFKFAIDTDPEIVFGGETSGHFVFRNFYHIDDGLLAALKFLKLWQDENIRQKLIALTKKYFELPEKNFPCPKEKASAVLEKASEYYRQKGYDISIIDGLSVFGPYFKFNLRASLTEAFLRLNLEARSEKQAQRIIEEIELLIN